MKPDFMVLAVIVVLLSFSVVGCVRTDTGEHNTGDGVATYCTDGESAIVSINMRLL